MQSLRILTLAFLVCLGMNGKALAVANNYDTYFLPDMFSIDRIPVSCGVDIFVLDKTLPVVGVNKGDGHIVLNPDILEGMPEILKLYVASHECAYTVVGHKNEAAAACWAVQNGRDQGWFSPKGFKLLTHLLREQEDGWPPPLSARAIAALKKCYAH